MHGKHERFELSYLHILKALFPLVNEMMSLSTTWVMTQNTVPYVLDFH
jgi:hypothetical protein